MKDLASLTPAQTLLDGGSGESLAIQSYLAMGRPFEGFFIGRTWAQVSVEDGVKLHDLLLSIGEVPTHNKANVVGVTFTDKPGRSWSGALSASQLQDGLKLTDMRDGQLRIFKNRFFEEINPAEIGKVDLIVDIWGIFSYAANPAEILSRYLSLLQVGGSIYIRSDNVVFTAPGEEWMFISWLKSLSLVGLRIEVNEQTSSYRITKLHEHIRFPELQVFQVGGGTPSRKILIRQ